MNFQFNFEVYSLSSLVDILFLLLLLLFYYLLYFLIVALPLFGKLPPNQSNYRQNWEYVTITITI